MSFTRKTSTTNLKLASIGANRSPLSTSAELTTSRLTVTERTRKVSEYGSRPVTPAIAEARALIQKEEWLAAARRSTEQFKRYGSPLPLVWVLTEGNEIPDNAVPFEQDRNGCTTYVARALLEGGLHIGKVSPQFAGAIIGFAGREHVTAQYEVLVCASQLRWGFSPPVDANTALTQGTVILAQQCAQQQSGLQQIEAFSLNTGLVESDVLRFIPDRGDVVREAGLKRLAEIKTVIMIDDSASMRGANLWEQAREALGDIVDIAKEYGSKGCDIHFMHGDDYAPNIRSKAEVDVLFNRIFPDGKDTPTGAKLGQIINNYLPLIESEHSTHEPITVLVITDGLASDQANLETVIVDAARRLDRNNLKHNMFRIQFVQIGTDAAASELLRTLDDDLVTRYKIRDMVDSTPFDVAQGAFDGEYMLKILLGRLGKDVEYARPNNTRSALLSPSPRNGIANSPRLGTINI